MSGYVACNYVGYIAYKVTRKTTVQVRKWCRSGEDHDGKCCGIERIIDRSYEVVIQPLSIFFLAGTEAGKNA